MAALATEHGPMPEMTIAAAGFGAGTADLGDRPNLTQVVIGARTAALDRGQPVTVLEVNVDDATGEQLAHTIAEVLDAGAHDAWLTPILMKKGRPAYTVSALADPSVAAQVADVLRRETGSLGVRGHTVERWPQSRAMDQVEVQGFPVRVKVGGGRAKVEHDDAVRVARRTGLTRAQVVAEAEFQLRSRGVLRPTEVPPYIHGEDHRHDHDHDGHDHGDPDDEGTAEVFDLEPDDDAS
jgi:uncharacterized protein (DUF111 family)